MIFIKQYGQGERFFVCLHGWGGDHREFAPLAARIPEEICLLSPDLPGYGESPQPLNWDLANIVEDLAQVIRTRQVLPCSLVGYCSGAIFALLLARRLPDQVRRIILIDPFAYVPWYFRIFLAGEFGRRAYATTFQTELGRGITDWILKRMQKADADFTQSFRSLNHDVTLRYLRLLNQIDLARDIGPIQVPIHLVHGANTFGAVRRSPGIFRQIWPQITVEEISGQGHLPLVKGRRQLRSILFEQEFT